MINIETNDNEIHKFEVIVDGIGLYNDMELLNEVFSIQINNKEIINGFYINQQCKIIYLTEYEVYVSAMEVNEMPGMDINEIPQMNNMIMSNSISEHEHNDIEVIEKESVVFKVVVDGVGLYKDKDLKEEIFSVQLHDNEIVDGYYIDDMYKIVYLEKFQLYISSMDVREININEDEEDIDSDDNKAEEKQHKIENIETANVNVKYDYNKLQQKYDYDIIQIRIELEKEIRNQINLNEYICSVTNGMYLSITCYCRMLCI